MKSLAKKIISLLFYLLQHFSAVGQETTSLGISYDALGEEAIVDLLFNRTSAEEAKDQYDIKIVKDAFVLNPAAEVHLGGGNESSPNNIIVTARLYYKDILPSSNPDALWTNFYKIDILSPEFTSDKNFSVYQGFATLGGSFTPSYRKREAWGDVELRLAAYYNHGLSKLDDVSSRVQVSRFKLDPSFQWSFGRVKSAIPPPLNPDFYYKISLSAYLTHYYFIRQDNRIVDEKSIGYFNADVGYRLTKHFKVSINYKNGRLEPLYEKIESLNLGLAFIY